MPTIAANLVTRNGTILMLYRSDKNYWELPAGKIEKGENAREAAKREAREEIGVEVKIIEEWQPFQISFDHEGRNFSTRGFMSEIAEGKPEIQEKQFSKLDWFGTSEIEELDLAPNLEMIEEELKQLLKQETVS